MILDVQITRVEEARSGISANGLPYCRRSIVVAFQEGSNNGQIINQAITVDLVGEDAQRQYTQFQTVKIELFFGVSNYKGRTYQNVRGTIIQPQAAPATTHQAAPSGIFGN